MESGQPRFRDFAKLLWAVGHGDARKLRVMGAVRHELLRVVHSPLTDEQAALQIGELVRADRRAAQATLRYVSGIRDHIRTYETDRAYRVLVAAMTGAPPEPVQSEDVGLFERERALVMMPLDQAFDQLVSTVPELEAIRQRAEQLARPSEAPSAEREAGRRQIVVSGELHSQALGDADRFIGPGSRHPDALVRSTLARQVVGKYVTAILADPALAQRALWDQNRPWPTVRWSGSF